MTEVNLAHFLLEAHNRQQLSDLFVFAFVCNFEEEDSLENLHSVLFCLIKKRSVQPFLSVTLSLSLFQTLSVRGC